MSPTRPRLLASLLGLLSLLAVGLLATPGASASPTWAPASTAAIHPGTQMMTAGAQCTANFVFTDSRGRVYVGYAAHCAGLGSSSDTNGCTTKSLPLGTPVDFVTGSNFFSAGTRVGRGALAYSSWLSMQRLHVTAVNRCAYNDFALVRVNLADQRKVNPTMPHWGGPTGLATVALPAGSKVYTVGNSALRGGFGSGAAKTGTVLDRTGGGLAYDVKTGNPGIPGDSGSGFMDASGHAAGVLSTLGVGLGINPVTNTIGWLAAEVAWAQKYSGIPGLTLAKGTVRFVG